MKKTLLLAVCLFCLLCQGQTFSIDARVNSLKKADKAYIMYRTETRRIDTLTCIKNGRLTYSTPMEMMTEARLFIIPPGKKMTELNECETLPLCVGPFAIQIKAAANDLGAAEVKGGIYNTPSHVEYYSTLRKYSLEKMPISKRMKVLMKEKVADNEKEAYRALISATNDSLWSISKKEIKFKEEWVLSHTDDDFSAFVLKNSGSKNIKNLYSSLSSHVQSSTLGLEIDNLIKVNEAFDNGRKNLRTGTVFADFTLTEANGKKLSLSSLQGKYVLIDFWGSWCGPCRQANRHMVELYNKYKDYPNFEMVSMALDKDDKAWREAINKDSLTWHQVNMCEEKDELKAINVIHGIYLYPTVVLLSPEGEIIAIQLGENAQNDMIAKKLNEVFGK
ncbi:MAG: TlpA disulfide reductase family protein [Flavobacteriales bacterium]|nr:TlpA disulfide reductase family protein [Flavobacteriales bacterium]